MFDDDFTKVQYNYFNDDAIIEAESSTYADDDVKLELDIVSWNHSMSEIITSLRDKDLIIDKFLEFDYSPYDCFRHLEKIEERKYRIKHLDRKMPMVYAIVANNQ